MELTLIYMLSKTKRVFTTHLPVLCSIASRSYYNGNVEGVVTFVTICAADEGGGMEIYMTVAECVLFYKLKEAAFLLSHSNFTLAEISNQLAFSSQSHFTVAFKKKYSYTPQKYREKFIRECL